MCDEVLAITVDHSEMRNIGSLATVFNKKVKHVYDNSCRKWEKNFINKMGPSRRLKCRMLKDNNYVCPQCIKTSFDKLEVNVMTLCPGLTGGEMNLLMSLYRND